MSLTPSYFVGSGMFCTCLVGSCLTMVVSYCLGSGPVGLYLVGLGLVLSHLVCSCLVDSCLAGSYMVDLVLVVACFVGLGLVDS